MMRGLHPGPFSTLWLPLFLLRKNPPIEFLIFSTLLLCITVYNIVDSYVQICLYILLRGGIKMNEG